MVRISISSCSNMKTSQHTMKKSGTAAVALFVALAAVPVLADTRKAIPSGNPASLQMSQELEQGTYREMVIRRLAGETFPRARGNNSDIKEGQTGTQASLQMSQEPGQGTYREMVIRRLAGETFPRARGKHIEIEEGVQTGTQASLQMRQEPEQGTYQERIIRRLSGETFPARGKY